MPDAVGSTTSYTLSGSLSGGERWSTTLWGPLPPAGGSAQQNAATFVALPAFGVVRSTILSLLNTGSSFTDVTLRKYLPSGQLADVGSVKLTGAVQGTGGAASPNQIAMVVSLQTANRTRSGRGRLYLPANGVTVAAATGKNASVDRQAVATAFANLYDNIDGGVASKTLNQLTAVTQIRVGDVLDTQRRRRDALVEAYATADVPTQ